jgi:hypothetical protein
VTVAVVRSAIKETYFSWTYIYVIIPLCVCVCVCVCARVRHACCKKCNPCKKHVRFGRAMFQAVSRRPPTAEARVRARVSPCGIFGGPSGTGIGFFPEFFGFPLSISFHRSSTTRKRGGGNMRVCLCDEIKSRLVSEMLLNINSSKSFVLLCSV